MEEFKFTLDPEKFKKNLQEKQQEQENDDSNSDQTAKNSRISESDPSEIENTSKGRFPIINMPDVVVFEDEFELDSVPQNPKLKNAKKDQNSIHKRQREQKKAEEKEAKATEKLAKKEAKKEAKKHKGNNILFYIAFGLVFVILSVSLSLTVFFNVETVEVEDSLIYTADEVIAASGVTMGENVFLISSEKIESNIVTALPYIKSVDVQKRLDNKIVITVHETYDYMVVASNSGFAVLSPEKKVLRFLEGSYPKNLVHVFGLKVSNVHVGEKAVFDSTTSEKALDELIPMLIKTGFSQTGEINVFDLSSIKIQYDDRILINIGTQSELEYKLTFAMQAINTSIEEDAVGTLNLSQLTSKNREIQFRREGFYNVVKTVQDLPEVGENIQN